MILGLNIYESFFLFKRGIIKHYCMLLYAMHGIKAIILLSFLRSGKLFGEPKVPSRIFMAAPITVLREKLGRSCGRDLKEFECQKEETQNSARERFCFSVTLQFVKKFEIQRMIQKKKVFSFFWFRVFMLFHVRVALSCRVLYLADAIATLTPSHCVQI